MVKTLDIRGFGIGSFMAHQSSGSVLFIMRSKPNPDARYYDYLTNQPIRSIGQHKTTKLIYASTDIRYHSNPNFECLFCDLGDANV